MGAFASTLHRDVQLAFRAGGGTAQTIVFFALTIFVFALGAGPDPALLSAIAVPVLWASALLAGLFSLDRVFQADFEDGSLDLLVMEFETLSMLIVAKALAHWLTTALPLVIISPVLGLLLALPGENYLPLMLALLIGTPALSLIGTLAAALTFSMRRANVLMTILTLPLFAPVLIFGVTAAEAEPGRFVSSALFLAAFSLFSIVVVPFAGAAAIRFNLD